MLGRLKFLERTFLTRAPRISPRALSERRAPTSPHLLSEASTMRNLRLRGLATAALSALMLTTAAAVAAAQGGTLQGTVTAANGGPLQEARVIVLGTSLFGSTGPDGKYVIRRVPAGHADVRIIRVGYQEQKKAVAILDGQNATLDVVMNQTVVQLQEVVTTATGEQRRVEV